MSHRIPPCRVPMGLACCGPAVSVTIARPSDDSLASKPIRRPTGTSLDLTLLRKSGRGLASGTLMFSPYVLWTLPREHSFRNILPGGGRQYSKARGPAEAVQ